MTPTEMKKMDDADIVIEVQQLRRKLLDLRSQQVTEKIQNTSQFSVVKKNIARLLTEQTARAQSK